MFSLPRAAIAVVCSLTLALPTSAAAAEPEEGDSGEPSESSDSTSDDLSSRASEHVVKAIRLVNSGDYVSAESELKRAEFFSPKWRAIHFNLAVVQEAQGKLGSAIKEYEKFKPHATEDEKQLVDQRLFELNDRKKKIAGAYKSQIALGAGAMVIGAAGLGVGGLFVGLYIKNNKEIESLESANNTTDPFTGMNIDNNSEISELTGKKTKLLYGAIAGFAVGLVILAYGALPLSKAVKSKRQLDGLALGPTRLKWNGGMGATLRF